ncbi:protein-methionine-sulfoxide reductase catalytic subunit MsrP [Paracoccus lutimaris]|uniref:Protein-methionine-sulfoxide reductase catalytic subunit MsrP n=1 Tax=Paracoccus lutimaris TaxID=1490030 RepID=A0A368YXJ1_9RHOB|nr:protein-methionine-sulfoxide reductase catalytic subunit MsrP [Paracoccus lutimaris]RCW83976.1 sulfoxide reductase catalytic subunit YedY [Paracoccus lutimaris]
MKLNWSDVTPEVDYLSRRSFIAAGMAALATPALGLSGAPSGFSTDEAPNSFEEITNYNNFYEFGTGKTDPANYSGSLKTSPWSVTIDGLVERPGSYGVEDLAPESALEERIYRLRCVEAWSMVIPWLGVPLASILAKAGVRPGAKYVAFRTLEDPEQMPGQHARVIDWPYREGLRLDEAMHPLTIMATGLYGRVLPNQNGAPIRLVVPWKYGFKSIKSIVSITLTDRQPETSWEMLQPNEYGFYANVNPQVDHPRWSQATERRVGAGLLAGRQETLMFNGYADQVAGLYAGMDLAKHY